MDTQTLGAAIAICKALPGSAAAEAIAAADRADAAATEAEASAAMAAQHGYGLSVSGHTLVVTAAGGGET